MRQSVAIIGTGLSGLMQAMALAAEQIPVTLIGDAPVVRGDDLRTTAIWQPGIDLLKRIGVWDAVSERATRIDAMEIIDGGNNFLFDAAEIELECLGYNIPNAFLAQALGHRLKHNSFVTWHKQQAGSLLRQNAAWRITLTDGKNISAPLVIGADGRNSLVRRKAEIDCHDTSDGQAALVALLQAQKPHHHTSVEWHLSGGPLTFVPVDKNRLALVWCEAQENLREKSALPKDALERELTELSEDRFGALKLIGDTQSWPVIPMQAARMTADGIALIGEAAHILPPLGAQGFNTSLADIDALTKILSQARDLGLGFDDAALLARYERRRQPDVALRVHGVNFFNSLMRKNAAPLRFLRGKALAGLYRVPAFKKSLMRFGLRQAL